MPGNGSNSALLLNMITAAREAGAILKSHFASGSGLTVKEKSGPNDLCTSADLASQAIIRDILLGSSPEFGFVGEEDSARPTSVYLSDHWLVDPLDGTMNYVRGIPFFAVNIALIRKGRAVAGVTYLPMVDELFCAEKGSGAYLNGSKIAVSSCQTLSASAISIGIPFKGKPKHRQFATEMANITPKAGQIRRLGACAIEMAYVACGRLDAYWEQSVSPWDIGAGAIIVQEAGGVATDTSGGILKLTGGTCLVTTPDLQSEILEILRKSADVTDDGI